MKIQEKLTIEIFEEVIGLVKNKDMDIPEAFNHICKNSDDRKSVTAKNIAEKIGIEIEKFTKRINGKDYFVFVEKDDEDTYITESAAARILGYTRPDHFLDRFVLKGYINPFQFPLETRRKYLKKEVLQLAENFNESI
ncbi:MAG: hypothetical protein HYS24_03440 [Ignavibacteriales bacterium]|nr:hypothetical protein [Ignavibacteriales bacterium]